MKSKQWVTVLTCAPIRPWCLKNVERLPSKYETNVSSWVTTKLLEDYLTQLDRKLGAYSHRNLLFVDECAAHSQNMTFLSNVRVVFLPSYCISQLQPLGLRIIHACKFCYRKQFIWNTVVITCGKETAARCCINSQSLKIGNTHYNQNGFLKCGFSIGHISSNETQ
jgi:hypothetical protein